MRPAPYGVGRFVVPWAPRRKEHHVCFENGRARRAKSTDAKSTDAKPKFTSAQLKAFLAQCSDEADAKGLEVKKGKAAERKEFRRACMHKLGVDPR